MMQPVLLHLIQVWFLQPPLLLLLPLQLPLPATGDNSRDLHIERRVGHYVAIWSTQCCLLSHTASCFCLDV